MLQGTKEWRQARCGSVGASQVYDVITRAAKRWQAELIGERLTGIPADCFVSAQMKWGIEHEPEAVRCYEFYRDVDTETVGIVPHPRLPHAHASPDRLVGDAGLIEIKCPDTSTHVATLLTQLAPAEYVPQMQWQLACTGREWCDFVSFDPRMPAWLRLFVKRVYRDPALIARLEADVSAFVAETDATITRLEALYRETRTHE